MRPIRLRAIVPKDHRLEIRLPDEVPEGPAEIEVTVRPENGAAEADRRARWLSYMESLDRLRAKYAHLNIRLSDALVANRLEEDY